MQAKQIIIKKPSDMHMHVREGEMLPSMATLSAKNFAYIEVMPNTNPAKLTGQDVVEYVREIERFTGATKVIGSIKITPKTDATIIAHAHTMGIRAGKLYFGITTNEATGARDIEPYFPALEAMEKVGMILQIHGEMAYDEDGKKIINLRREEAFIPIARRLVKKFPNLKIIFEHITTAQMVNFIMQQSTSGLNTIAATITVQHLHDDIDAILGYTTETGEGINAHNYCKPVLKFPEDRTALRMAAISGLHCFFFGSDSAPHLTENKECCCGKPGVFSAMTRIETLAEIFEEEDSLDMLEGFTSLFGPAFYGLPPVTDTITLIKEPWTIPAKYAGVTNYRQGEKIAWRVKE